MPRSLGWTSRPIHLGFRDIYVSRMRGDSTLSPPELVTELSSTGDELKPSIRFDGLEIFFQSYRFGISTSYDIWVYTRKSNADTWSPPVELGQAINSAYHDLSPASPKTAPCFSSPPSAREAAVVLTCTSLSALWTRSEAALRLSR